MFDVVVVHLGSGPLSVPDSIISKMFKESYCEEGCELSSEFLVALFVGCLNCLIVLREIFYANLTAPRGGVFFLLIGQLLTFDKV